MQSFVRRATRWVWSVLLVPAPLAAQSVSGFGTLRGEPRYAVLSPYALGEHPMRPDRYRALASADPYTRRMAQPYGLIEVATRRITHLLDAPHLSFAPGDGPPVWAPDGRSVLVHTFLPLGGDERDTARANAPARWVEVDVATRRITPLPIPDGAQPLAWTAAHGVVLALKDSTSAAFAVPSNSWATRPRAGSTVATPWRPTGASWWGSRTTS